MGTLTASTTAHNPDRLGQGFVCFGIALNGSRSCPFARPTCWSHTVAKDKAAPDDSTPGATAHFFLSTSLSTKSMMIRISVPIGDSFLRMERLSSRARSASPTPSLVRRGVGSFIERDV